MFGGGVSIYWMPSNINKCHWWGRKSTGIQVRLAECEAKLQTWGLFRHISWSLWDGLWESQPPQWSVAKKWMRTHIPVAPLCFPATLWIGRVMWLSNEGGAEMTSVPSSWGSEKPMWLCPLSMAWSKGLGRSPSSSNDAVYRMVELFSAWVSEWLCGGEHSLPLPHSQLHKDLQWKNSSFFFSSRKWMLHITNLKFNDRQFE